MSYTLRAAQLSDLRQLRLIEAVCFRSDNITPRQMRYLLQRAKAVVSVAVDTDGLVVAYSLGLTPALPRAARLYSLAVLPQHRGHGVAAQLMAALMAQLSRMGYLACTLEVRASDKHTQALYCRFGFKPVAKRPAYYADGADAIAMRATF